VEAAKVLFDNLFFNVDRYDLSRVGRLKLNYKFPENGVSAETTILTKEDILSTLYYYVNSTMVVAPLMILITSEIDVFGPW
jgi:DNA-directed RNA polymerase subunit beta